MNKFKKDILDDLMNVVDKIAKVPRDSQDKPLQDVVINKAYLI